MSNPHENRNSLLWAARFCGLYLCLFAINSYLHAQVMCRVHWECPAGSTGIAGCQGVMGAMSGDGTPTQFATNDACNLAVAQLKDGIKRTCKCGTAAAAPSTSTGSLTGDTINMAANLWIIQNVKNPYAAVFAQNFTQGFLTGLFSNKNPQAEKQRQDYLNALHQQQLEAAQREADAARERLNAMYARLGNELKLSGLGGTLNLKLSNPSNTNEMPLKLSNNATASNAGLQLKLGNDSPGYGIPNLPGTYTGGARSDDNSNSLGLKTGNQPTNPDQPTPPSDPGKIIPNLPGIYLDNIPPQRAPEVAVQALQTDGPQRAVYEDAAIQSARLNPLLTQQTDDPIVQNAQQQIKTYDAVQNLNNQALADAAQAQGQAQAERNAVNSAAEQLQSTQNQNSQVQQAYQQMLTQADSQEQLATQARVTFEGTTISVQHQREQTTTALAMLAPPESSTANAPNPQPSNHNAQPTNTIQVLTTTSKPQIFTPPSKIGTPYHPLALPVESLQQCLAHYTPSGQMAPSQNELEAKLVQTLTALERLESTNHMLSVSNEEWKKMLEKTREGIIDDAKDKLMDGIWGISETTLEERQKDLDAALDASMERGKQLEWEIRATSDIGNPNEIVKANLKQHIKDSKQLLEDISDNRERAHLLSEFKEVVEGAKSGKEYAEKIEKNVCNIDPKDLRLNCKPLKDKLDLIESKLASLSQPATPGTAKVSNIDLLNSSVANLIQKQIQGVKNMDDVALAEIARKILSYAKKNQTLLVLTGLAPEEELIKTTWDLTSFAINAGYYGLMLKNYHDLNLQSQDNKQKYELAYSSLGKRINLLSAQVGCYASSVHDPAQETKP